MGIFRRTTPLPELPAQTDEDCLAEIERDFRIADRAFVDACLAVVRYRQTHKDPRLHFLNGELYASLNAMTCCPELLQLERNRDKALRRRSELLRVRAELTVRMGLVR